MKQNESLRRDVAAIRTQAPLVHNITNFVVMNNTANALLAVGASPVMAHAVEEVEEMVRLAGALVVNVGTLSPEWVCGMERAMHTAREVGVPIVYDPVGAGATAYRNVTNERLLNVAAPTIIRGNGSEIQAVAAGFGLGSTARTKGVDSTAGSEAAVAAACALSERLGAVVVVSGPTDYIVSGNTVRENSYGTPLMTRVTGMGCTATAVCGAFAAVNADAAEAAANAMTLMGRCGEQAALAANGPGSFQVAFLDALYRFEA
jgi:hydroxyethylthiazole kinase